MKLKFKKTLVFNKQTITRTAEIEGEEFSEAAIAIVRELVEARKDEGQQSESVTK